MALTLGDQLGPYKILAPLGAGGMGEVYRATDTQLGRDVALKVIPTSLAHDEDRLARFKREAKVLASLNHPNIAQIYGIEQSALVMELVPGEQLQGPLPLPAAIQYARQIAEALEAAHEKGIVHRDLKPANIIVTPEGVVKVLDFGIAAVAQGSDEALADPLQTPTLTMRATQAGVIMGTSSYMSPEQAAGQRVDKRSDIWAFGVVFWELLTGRLLFQGDTVTHTLAAVLRDEISFDALPSSTPPAVRALLRRCLERDVRNRLRDIGEARVILTAVAEGKAETAPPPPAAGARAAWIAAALAGLASLGLGVALWRAPRPAPQPFIQLQANLGEELASGSRFTPAVSPDGSQIAYTVKSGTNGLLAVRSLSENKAVVLPGTEGANLPFFSPDGRWIGFFAEDKLKKISPRGGPAVLLCPTPTGRGADWGQDGSIVASFNFAGGLYKIPAAGGEPQVLTKPADHGQISHRWPQFLPGGKAVLFTAHTATADFDQAAIETLSLEAGTRKTIVRGGYFGRFLPSGHLLYMHDGMLFAAAFDPVRLELRGAPLPILEDVLSYPGSGSAHFAFSPAGTFVYLTGSEVRLPYPIVWADASGNAQALPAPPALYETLRLSPDGKRLAVSVNPAAGDLWIHDVNLGNPIRLTDTARNNHWPVWMPDGKHIIYSSLTGQGYAFWWKNSDGSGEPRQLRATHNEMHTYSVSPDGKWLAYDERNPETRTDLWLLPLDTSDPERPVAGNPHPLLRSPRSEGHPVFSPDGKWIAFVGSDSGAGEVYVRPGLDAQGRPSAAVGLWRISNGGGDFPVWSKTDKKLYFTSRERYVMVAEYKAQGESFEAGPPRQWSAQPLNSGGALNFDLAPDGRRVLAFQAAAPARPREALRITFLLNFFDEVERRLQSAAPAGK